MEQTINFKKPNMPILIATLLISFVLILSGIVVGVVDSIDSKTSSSPANAGSQTTPSAQTYGPYSIYLEQKWSRDNVAYGDRYLLRFSPSASVNYYIAGDGIDSLTVRDSNGNYVTKYATSKVGYDMCYRVALSNSQTYTIEIKANSENVKIFVYD